ncbi:MAG TPA: L,D-transpeptidase family protein [Patescibacteria group bacterium]|nr:L,D-transpeptidase family protein [Patescibacteria group bacterium]
MRWRASLGPRHSLALALMLAAAVAARAQVSEVDALRAATCGAATTRVRATESADALCVLYSVRAFRPLWLDAAGQPTPAAWRMIALMQRAEQRGLRAADYDAEAWAGRAVALLAGGPAARAEFDDALTRQVLRFALDLHRGRIDPRRLGVGIGIDPSGKRLDLPMLVEALARAQDPEPSLEALEPPFAGYRRLRRALATLRVEASRDDVVVPALSSPVLEPGDADAGVPALRARLLQLGDLVAIDAVVEAGGETRYDPALAAAVQRFQARHGLMVDGRLGAKTWSALNVPLSQRLGQVRFAMERWRWVPSGFPEPPIVVNIPEFQLRAVGDDGRLALEMPVVVGRAFRTETPVFAELLRTLVFRPSWTVPQSIVRDELLPRALRDPGYFARQGFEIVGVDDPSLTPETQAGLRRGQLALRQKPGPGNALGRVKFLFPNAHAVYLHDTPSRGAFARTRRDLSHGCVRVQDPEALANFVLRKQPEWTPERIRAALDGDQDDVAVTVSPPIPVYLVYVTAVAPGDGTVHFFDDLYGHDARLQTALDQDSGRRCGVVPLRACARD